MNIVLFSQEDNYTFLKNDERYLHIKKVLKLDEGDEFKAGIINGKIGRAVITNFSDEKLVFEFHPMVSPEAFFDIKIILGFPRPIQLRRILRDAASLGFSELFLTGTELGEKSYLQSNLATHVEIRKYILDGIMQAGQTMLPDFSICNSIKEVLQKLNNSYAKVENNSKITKKILFDISNDAKNLKYLNLTKNDELIIAIGNERGWTNNERHLFAENGFKPFSLGKRILRTETAVCAALSILTSNMESLCCQINLEHHQNT